MLQEQLIEEIKQIPNDKLAEVYDLIHYFRIGLLKEKQKKEEKIEKKVPQFGFAKGTFIMTDDFDKPLEEFEDYM